MRSAECGTKSPHPAPRPPAARHRPGAAATGTEPRPPTRNTGVRAPGASGFPLAYCSRAVWQLPRPPGLSQQQPPPGRRVPTCRPGRPAPSGQPNTATERSEAMTPRETTTRRGTTTRSARAVREHTDPPAPGWRRVLLHVVGSGLLIATGAINLDLYLTGYRAIPAIGRLFLLQAIAAVGLARAVPAILSRLV